MDLALDLNVVVTLLFTFLALLLASVFLRLRGGAAEPPQASGTGGEAGPEGEANRLPVEEVGAGEEGKEVAAEQREEAVEPGPAAPSIPPAAPSNPPAAPSIPEGASNIPPAAPSIPEGAPSNRPAAPSIPEGAPSNRPAAPSIPEGTLSTPSAAPSILAAREDVGGKIPPLDASPEPSPGHMGQAEGGCGHAELSSKAEEEDPDSENEKLVVREPEDEEAADEMFSFKYSPGKLRGNQYKSMMTKEELEEEQRTEDYMKLSLASS